MSSIVYQRNPRSGSTYAYRSTSYRDPTTGKPRSKREYLGRVDPETGEIIPKASKGRRNRSKLGEAPAEINGDELVAALKYRDDEFARLRQENERLRQRNAELEAALQAVSELVAPLLLRRGQ